MYKGINRKICLKNSLANQRSCHFRERHQALQNGSFHYIQVKQQPPPPKKKTHTHTHNEHIFEILRQNIEFT